LRTVRRLSNRSGEIVARYEYDPFGRLLTTSPASVTALFTGRPYDAAVGILDYRLRQYDPALGRFLQRDPLNLTFPLQHSYAYVGNNPVNRIDPLGLWFNSLYEAVGTVALGLGAVALVGVGLVAAGVIAVPAAVGAITAAAGTTAGTLILGGAGVGAVINAAVTLGQRGVGPQGTTLPEVLGAAVVGGVIGGIGAGIAAGVSTLATLATAQATWGTGALGGALGGGVGALVNEVNNQTHGEPFRPAAVALGTAGGSFFGAGGAYLGTAEGTALSACSGAWGSLLGEVGPQ
jgi:RHS repeat-associated protein